MFLVVRDPRVRAGPNARLWLARVLMKAKEGDVVALNTPNGVKRIEVVKIAYEAP